MSTTNRENSRLRIGFLAPAVLIFTLAADASLRFLPIEWLAFRPWEVVALRRHPPAPFAPDQQLEEARVYGDLAALGNMPQHRHYHPQKFSTDGFGFRNSPALVQSNSPAALLVGSSFSIGASVNDDETLAAQLSRLSGRVVYNAGGLSPADASSIRELAQRLNMRSGWVIYEFLERNSIPKVKPSAPPGTMARTVGSIASWPGVATVTAVWQVTKPSRLKILAQRGYKALQNDRVLPNVSSLVACQTLRNGDEMLFLRDHLKSNPERDVSRAGEYWPWLAGELKKSDLSLLVVLVPEKVTIYKPFFRDIQPTASTEIGYLDRNEQVLRARGIPVINLASPFRREAQARFQQGDYIYHLDDTHWNASGILIAAKEILDGWRGQMSAAGRDRAP